MCCYQPHRTKEVPHAYIAPVAIAAANNIESSVSMQSDTSTVEEQVHDEVAGVVRFAEPLVTQVIPRPRTSPGDVEDLYYSREDTERFRQEYIALRRAHRQKKAQMMAAADAADNQATAAQEHNSRGYGQNNQQTAGGILRRFLSYVLTAPSPVSVVSTREDQSLSPVASPTSQKDGSPKPVAARSAAAVGGAAELLYTWDLGMVVSSSF